MRLKTVSLLLIFLFIFTAVIFAKEATLDMVKNVAQAHIQIFSEYGKLKPEKLLNGMAPKYGTQISKTIPLYDKDNKVLVAYIMELDPKGYVVISVDTDIEPVIAYSFRCNFSMEEVPQNALLHILRVDLMNRIEKIKQLSSTHKAGNNSAWDEYFSINRGDLPIKPEMADWGPYLDTYWDQGGIYNDSCPMDPNTGQQCITGCVATAMAQIVNYWEYPSSVTFTTADNYTSVYNPGDGYGTRVIDIYAPDASMSGINYNGNGSHPNNQTIADLHFACGVRVEMMYSSSASGAYHRESAYKGKFQYATATLTDPGSNPNFYDDLRADMYNAKPAQIGAYGWIGGHSIVCDGYRSTGTNVFHINYGWSGSHDGWYSLPGGLYGLNTLGDCILNIHPTGGTNTPPEASNLEITPSEPTSDDDLVGSYDYYDANGDPESGTEIRWYKNTVLQSAYDDLLTIPSSATSVGDEWNFTVLPSDGSMFGSLQTSPTVTVVAPNTPPIASNLQLAPSTPKTGDDLVGSYDYYDADEDAETGTKIRWYRNGSLQSAYNDQLTVPSSATTKGQNWYFTVEPYDGEHYGIVQTSATVTILNTAPVASNAVISPTSPDDGDNLDATYNYIDADNDSESGSEIRWYKNGAVQSAYNDLSTVPAGATAIGEDWHFTIRPNDGSEFGTLQTSPTVTIGAPNTPPVASNLQLTPVVPKTANNLSGSYTYYDANGDPESGSEIRWYKNGSVQSTYNDQLTIPASATSKNEQWYFTVRPNDGKDFGTLKTSPSVTIENTAPTVSDVAIVPLSPVDTDDLNTSYDYNDADNDTESGSEIRWYKNGSVQTAYNDVSTVPAAATSINDQWYYTIRPNDGTEFGNLVTSTTVTVVESNPPPEAEFVGNPCLGISPLEVHFSDKSTGNVRDWFWQFGDGEISNKRNPSHIYESETDLSYDVTLTVTDFNNFRSSITKNDYIQISIYIEAAFDAGPTVGYSPLTVEFNELTLGSVDDYYWDFGDGATSTEQAPVHVYMEPGIYTVSLTVNGPGGTDTKTVVDLIEVYEENEYIGLTYLSIVDSSSDWPGEGWENAIDHDTYHTTGTATVGQDKPWAIFAFDSGLEHDVIKFRMMHNTGVGSEGNHVTKFNLYSSFDGINYELINELSKTNSGWEDFELESAISTKFIKLTVEEPHTGWRHIGEFQVWEQLKQYDLSLSTINATSPHIANGKDLSIVTINLNEKNGDPVSDIDPGYFKIQATGLNNLYEDVTKTEVAGTYVGYFSSYTPEEKIVTVRVCGTKIESSTKYSKTPVIVTFVEPVIERAELVVVEGTQCRTSNDDWDEGIDGDSTTIVRAGPKWRDCWVIWGFADDKVKQVVKYRFATNANVKWPSNQVSEFEVYVSTTGTDDEDFTLLDDVWWQPGGWYEKSFETIDVRYIKLVLLQPKKSWRQFSEFEIYNIAIPELPGPQPTITSNNQKMSEVPSSYHLAQNFPNPFNPETKISYHLPEAAKVTVKIYNLLGQNIKTLVNKNLLAGKYSVLWNGKDNYGKDVSSGIYLYRLEAIGKNQSYTRTKKLMLIR